MLSSCWFTTPFTGCFSTAIKGGVGSGMQEAGDEEPRVRVSQPPLHSTKTLVNGAAGGALGAAGGGGGDALSNEQPAAGQQQQQQRTPRLEADRIIGGETMLSDEDKSSKRTYKSEYRKKFRPFSQYQYVDGKFHKVKTDEPATGSDSTNNWYKEVIELRRQAGQYRHRGWGVETASERLAEIYSKQAELWEQVSRRSSLQALSLASATPSRPISKAEKEIENSRRSSPIKHVSTSSRERPSTAPPKPKPAAVHSQKTTDKTDGKTSKESTPRHHYERSTGAAEEGLLITSPSRDKLEPFIPDDWSSRRSSRRTPPVTSPVKDGPSRRRTNRAASAARPPPTRDCRSAVGGRSVSVGPENRSPKRTSRPPATHVAAPTTKPERRPRPTSLSTSARRKGTDALPHRPSSHDEGRETKKPSKAKTHDPTASPKKGEDRSKADKKQISEEAEIKKDKEKEIIPKDGPKEGVTKDGPKEPVEAVKESSGRKSTPEPRFDPEKYEPVVKTPPEPTRVKSPDQVMVKSPDPVNWTVPLDTGKTFTVTHNIPEGESARGTPSSEYRHMLESRTRQTPEPTKLSQGPLVGTPMSSITSEAKPAAQEPPKPTTATTLESKTEDKPAEKKLESKPTEVKVSEPKSSETKLPEVKPELKPEVKPSDVKTNEAKIENKLPEVKPVETKPAEVKAPESKLSETKAPETKPIKPDDVKAEVKAPEAKPADTKVSEAKPADAKVSEAKPADTKVSEAKPADTKAAEVKHTDPKVSEAKPADIKVSEPKLTDTKVSEPKPAESKVPEPKPAESKVSEPKPADIKPTDTNPTESKVSESSKPIDTKAFEPTFAATKPADSKISDPKPADIKATESKLSESKVPESKPFDSFAPLSKPSESKAPESKAVDVKPFEPKKLESTIEPKPLPPQVPREQLHQGPPSPQGPTQVSPTDSVPPSSGAVDPMTMSMFGSLNGMNGKSSGTPSPTKPEAPLPSSEPVKDVTAPESKPIGVRNIPGTNLRCLDDPSFMFDQPGTATTNSPKAGSFKVLEAPVEPPQLKSGGYRVLEAPEAPSDIKDLPDQSPTKPEAPVKPSPYRVLEAPIDPPARPKGSPYRVLEAPDAPYYPQAQSVGATQESKPPSLVSPSSGRTVTDALDKARTRFDSFWGGPKDKDPPSKV